jgi:tetratricopeptide (TPR) repeat protein
LAALLLFAVITNQDSLALRSGCEADDGVVATLPLATRVEVQFAIADGSNCFKVVARVNGQPMAGYLPGAALSGLEEFERGRRNARDGGDVQFLAPVETLRQSIALSGKQPVLAQVAQLIEANQPRRALELIEPQLQKQRGNADAFFLAGLAAYRSDELRTALDYWKQSLELKPNETLAAFYHRAEREAANDRSSQTLYGMRVLLRYEDQVVSPDLARQMVGVLDQELTRISAELGCHAEERVVAIVQSREAYFKSTDAAEWSGGQYDGRIRVPLPESGIGSETRRVFGHEIVHACLAAVPGNWPAWFQEGMAQKLSGDSLSPAAMGLIHRMAAAHALPRLENVGQSWSRMSTQHARIAYALALAAVDLLYESYGSGGVRNLLQNPDRLQAFTAELDKRLGL